MVGDAYDLYRSRKPEHAPGEDKAIAFRERYSHPDAEIAFIGVWDTVGALGIPITGLRPPLLSRRWTFHDTTLSRFVRNAYHAVSIDERRRPFVPTLWVHKAPEEHSEPDGLAGVVRGRALRRRRRLSRPGAVGDPAALDGRARAGLRPRAQARAPRRERRRRSTPPPAGPGSSSHRTRAAPSTTR